MARRVRGRGDCVGLPPHLVAAASLVQYADVGQMPEALVGRPLCAVARRPQLPAHRRPHFALQEA
jgi:hypothetical protein